MANAHLKHLLGATGVVAILAGATGLYLSTEHGQAEETGSARADAKVPRYRCPMHPTMMSDRPGDCPICGMRLVLIETDAGAPASAAHAGHPGPGTETAPTARGAGPAVDGRAPIQLPERRRQLIGVRTAAVERRPLVRTIKTVGRVTYDETRLHHVHTKVAGWVERLYANATGQLLTAGEPLLTLYSPELVASAQEYLIALRGRETLTDATLPSARTSGDQLLASARRRLLLFDISPQQIRALEASGDAPTTMTLRAPISGHILTRNVTQGEKIEPGLNLFDIADLSHVWVLADVYEYELPFIRLGQPATMTLSYLPGRTFEGTVTLIYPVVAEATRTVKVRIALPNPGFTLRPEMYAEVAIHSDLGEALVIPESAVISTGQRDIAFVDHGDGTLEPRELKIGTRLAEAYEVLDGLAEGDRVVTSGNFLIDSESKLKAALAAAGMDNPGGGAGHSH